MSRITKWFPGKPDGKLFGETDLVECLNQSRAWGEGSMTLQIVRMKMTLRLKMMLSILDHYPESLEPRRCNFTGQESDLMDNSSGFTSAHLKNSATPWRNGQALDSRGTTTRASATAWEDDGPEASSSKRAFLKMAEEQAMASSIYCALRHGSN